MLSYLTFGIGFAFAAAVQPGPLLAYLASQALTNGWRRTMPAAFAPLLSDIPIAALSLLVLTRLPVGVQHVLQLVGGGFVLYLAWGAFTSWRAVRNEQTLRALSTARNVVNAVMVNLLNPSPYLGWCLVMGPLVLKGWRKTPANGIALIAAFYTTMVATLAVCIVLFSMAGRLGPKANRLFIGLSAMGLALLGCYQIWEGFRAVLAQ